MRKAAGYGLLLLAAVVAGLELSALYGHATLLSAAGAIVIVMGIAFAGIAVAE